MSCYTTWTLEDWIRKYDLISVGEDWYLYTHQDANTHIVHWHGIGFHCWIAATESLGCQFCEEKVPRYVLDVALLVGAQT